MQRMTTKWLMISTGALVGLLVTVPEISAEPTAGSRILFECNFDDAPPGSLPDTFMAIQGEFEVKKAGTNKVLELPGAPLDSYSVLFGPVTNADVMVEARILSTSKGRRMPTFGVGLGGVAGYKVQVAPAKDAIELLSDVQVVTSAPFEWKSGAWTYCQLQIRQTSESNWTVEASAWQEGQAAPKDWPLTLQSTNPPNYGQSSVLGSPFSGKTIQFDDLKVLEAMR